MNSALLIMCRGECVLLTFIVARSAQLINHMVPLVVLKMASRPFSSADMATGCPSKVKVYSGAKKKD